VQNLLQSSNFVYYFMLLPFKRDKTSSFLLQTQEDLFAFEERSGRQSTISWSAWSGHSRDLIAEELHYMREAGDGTVTPSTADPGDFRPWTEDSESGFQGTMTPGGDSLMTPGLMTPGGEMDVEMRQLMRMDSRPLTEDMETPFSLDSEQAEQHPLHPLNPARLYSKLARRALVCSPSSY
jgi:hypothetical protein